MASADIIFPLKSQNFVHITQWGFLQVFSLLGNEQLTWELYLKPTSSFWRLEFSVFFVWCIFLTSSKSLSSLRLSLCNCNQIEKPLDDYNSNFNFQWSIRLTHLICLISECLLHFWRLLLRCPESVVVEALDFAEFFFPQFLLFLVSLRALFREQKGMKLDMTCVMITLASTRQILPPCAFCKCHSVHFWLGQESYF